MVAKTGRSFGEVAASLARSSGAAKNPSPPAVAVAVKRRRLIRVGVGMGGFLKVVEVVLG